MSRENWRTWVILAENPLKVAPAGLKDIEVIETIKEGVTVYRAGERGAGHNPL